MGEGYRGLRFVGRRRLAALVLLALVLQLACGACEEAQPGSDADATDAAVDAGDAAARDASPDARVSRDGSAYEFCDEPLFKLPIDGNTESTTGADLEEGRVAYVKLRAGDPTTQKEIYLFDIQDCVLYQVTQGANAAFININGSELLWDDARNGWDDYCFDLYSLDLQLGVETRLTDFPSCEFDPVTNGRFIAYKRNETYLDPDWSFRLWDRQQGQDIELLPPGWAPKSRAMNERWLVWTAFTTDPMSVGRDVFYRDLTLGLTVHLDETYERWQDWVFVWEDLVTWTGADAQVTPPYHLILHSLATGDSTQLLEGDYSIRIAPISDGLVVYNTSRYTGSEDLNPSDIEIYDVESGIYRRVTTAPSFLRAKRIDFPHLLIIHVVGGMNMNDYYVADLVKLGITSPDGRVIPGDGALDPP